MSYRTTPDPEEYAAQLAERATLAEKRFAKLPAWARDEIATLRRQTADAVRHAEEVRLATNPDETDTLVDRGLRGEAIGLRPGSRVTFRVGRWAVKDARPVDKGAEIDVRLTRDGYLEVSSNGRPLVIRPWVTNVVRIEVDPR